MSKTISRRAGLATALVLAGLALFGTLFAGTSHANTTPATEQAGDFLINFGKRAVQELNDEGLSETERDRRFRALLKEAVDVKRIGKFVLGAHWRRASKSERGEFLAVFEDIAVQRFLPMFTRQSDEYKGSGFEIVDIKRDESKGGHIFVTVEILREEQDPIILVWRMRERKKTFKILDISAEGLSMALTLRQEYNSAIKKLGSVAELVSQLKEKLAAGAFAPKPVTAN